MSGRLPVGRALSLSVLVILVLSVVPVPVAALEVSDEYNITDTDDATGAPRVDIDSEGNFHIAYLFNDGGDYDKLMYRKVGPTGTTLGGPVQVSPGTVEGQYGALAISVDASGRSHIAFSVMTSNDDARNVYYAQVNADDGVSVAAKNVRVTDVAASSLDIESDASGNAYIVWNERSDPPTIMWTKISVSGSVSKSAQEVSGDLGLNGDVSYPRIGTNTAGESYIAWMQKDNALARWCLYYASLTSSGSVIEDPVQVASSSIYNMEFLEATCDHHDNLHMVYVMNGDIMWTMVEPDATVGDDGQIASPPIGEAGSPDISTAPNGDIYITYMERQNLINAPWTPLVHFWDETEETWTTQGLSLDGEIGTPRPAASNDMVGLVYPRANDIWLVTMTKEAANRPPVAAVSATPTDASVGETVSFDGSDSTDPDDGDYVDGYYFEWGDGGDSGWRSSSTANHAYTSAGTYTASLRVRDSYGLESTSAATVTVRVSSTPVNRAPVAVLTGTPSSVDTGQEVTFSGSGSSDPDGTVSNYWFDFGDGVNTGWVTTPVVKHSYTSESMYTATLNVRDDDGLQSENTGSVRITVVHTNEPPTADIVSITPNPALVGEEITFTGSSADADGEVEVYSWESNLDGIIGSTATFAISTLNPGTHTITFKVRDDSGDWSEPATTTLEVKANSPFTIVDTTQFPKQVYTDTLVEFRVTYRDPDGDHPTMMNLLYSKNDGDWKAVELLEVDLGDTDYADGKDYYFNKKFTEPGKWKYSFEFRNAKNPKKTTPAEQFEVKEAAGLLPGWEAAPATGAMMLVAIAMAFLARRREAGR